MNINKLVQKFLKDNKLYIVVYIVFMMAYPLTSVLLPKYYGQLIDDLKEEKKLQYKKPLILLIVTNIMYVFLDKIDSYFLPKLQAYIRVHIVKAVLQNYKDNFEEQEIGILISKIVKLPIVIRELARQIRNYIVPLIFIFLMIIIRFMIIDKRLGIITMIGITSFIIGLVPFFKKCVDIASDVDHVADDIHEEISELFDNLMDIYSMNTYEREMETLEKNQQKIIKRYKKSFDSTNNLRCVMNGVGIIFFISISVYSYKLYNKKEMTLANMMNVMLTSKYIIGKIGSFAGELPDLIFNIGSYVRAQKFLQELTIKELPFEESFEFPNGKIEYKDVGIKYDDKSIIKNFNITINPKETVAFIGKVGAGKSTLVKALLRLLSYDGKITIDGKNISILDPSVVRSQILYIRQNPIPFNRTLYENIVYGNEGVTKKEVANLLSQYDLHKFFTQNLDTPVGKKGGRLSGGQKMIMFLLRVIIQNKKKIVIIDEPTSSLDTETANKIIDILKDVVKKQTTIIITHDEKIYKIVNRIVKI